MDGRASRALLRAHRAARPHRQPANACEARPAPFFSSYQIPALQWETCGSASAFRGQITADLGVVGGWAERAKRTIPQLRDFPGKRRGYPDLLGQLLRRPDILGHQAQGRPDVYFSGITNCLILFSVELLRPVEALSTSTRTSGSIPNCFQSPRPRRLLRDQLPRRNC